MSKILLVDDDEIIRNPLRILLESINYSVIESNNTISGFKLLEKEHPNLVILDVMLPGITPREFINKVRDNPKYDDIKIVVMSGLSGLKEELKDNPFIAGIVEKPFENHKLLKLIKQLIN